MILAVLTVPKGEAAYDQILAQTSGVDVQIWPLDYESFASIDEFGKRAVTLDRLDIVIFHAGVKNLDYVQSKTGHESHVQLSHLGTVLLSLNLLTPLDWVEKVNIERYNTSKLLNVPWIRKLNARVTYSKLNIVISTVNPGFCASELYGSDLQASKITNLFA
ncbi:hypothetical protein DL771_001492 [Monosporascus sp. 5C6A]|nr:hypothetical protein DL771_001492 [Monosporascus sp. 5C6A]